MSFNNRDHSETSSSVSDCLRSYEDILNSLIESSVCNTEALICVLRIIGNLSEIDRNEFWELFKQKHMIVDRLFGAFIESKDIFFVSCCRMLLFLPNLIMILGNVSGSVHYTTCELWWPTYFSNVCKNITINYIDLSPVG
jgi:hypothetical protein